MARSFGNLSQAAAIDLLRTMLLRIGFSHSAARSNYTVNRFLRNMSAKRQNQILDGLEKEKMRLLHTLAQQEIMSLYNYLEYYIRRRPETYGIFSLPSAMEQPVYRQGGENKSIQQIIQDPIRKAWGYLDDNEDIALRDKSQGYGVLKGGFLIIIDDADLLMQLRNLNPKQNTSMESPSLALVRSVTEFQAEMPMIIEKVVDEAIAGLEEGAFPSQYVPPLKAALYRMTSLGSVPKMGPELGTIYIDYDFDSLGNYMQFHEAFHYKAMMSGGPTGGSLSFLGNPKYGAYGKMMRFPYTGQPLKNPEGVRYAYWHAIYSKPGGTVHRWEGGRRGLYKNSNRSWILGRKGKGWRFKGSTYAPMTWDIPADAWQETIQARLRHWATKGYGVAPQWLLLEFGQPRWAPKIPTPKMSLPGGWEDLEGIAPRGISGKFMKEASKKWTEIVERNMQEYFYLYPSKGKPRGAPGAYYESMGGRQLKFWEHSLYPDKPASTGAMATGSIKPSGKVIKSKLPVEALEALVARDALLASQIYARQRFYASTYGPPRGANPISWGMGNYYNRWTGAMGTSLRNLKWY